MNVIRRDTASSVTATLFAAKIRVSLRVFGTVVNDSDARRTARVRAVVDAAGEHYERTTEMTVDAGGEAEFGVVFEVRYDEFAKQGRVNVVLE